MKTYDKYKSSGIDWIGDIPEHWEVKRLKFLAKVNSSISNYEVSNSLIEEVVFLPMEKVSESGSITQDLRKRINEVSSGFTYFEKGDVILAKITPCFENGKGALLDNLETDFGFGSTEFHTIRAGEKVSSKLLFYITKSHRFRVVGEAFMSGSAGQKRVSADFVKDYRIALPPLPEQTAIANYLDEKTAQIDSLINNKMRLIELLKEERTAIINQVVTRGINPHAKLKPSGIAWLGDIPEQWKLARIKFFVNYAKGYAFKTDFFQPTGIPVIKASDIKSFTIRAGKDFLNPEVVAQFQSVKLSAGDIVISTVGSTPDVVNSAVGQIAKIPSEFDGSYLNQNALRIYSDDEIYLSNNYLFYFLISNPYRKYLDLHAHGTANQASLNVEDMLDFVIAFPSSEEQKQIVAFIETATEKIDATIAKIEKEIGFMREYRTALISEVVTGKIKVV
ncbi:MAG: restriction endonuclease subunit S [Pyrinomonadaceae bacterium]